jgi:uncharacterized protein (TIGR00369 family)
MEGAADFGGGKEKERMNAVVLSKDKIERLLNAEFPQAFYPGCGVSIELVGPEGCRVRKAYRENMIRPGGTISGPNLMELADIAMYVAVLAAIGPVPLAVTTNFNINFLRKAGQKDLIAEARLMKLGRRLAVGEVDLRTDGEDELVAHVTSTYSIPPRD